MATIEWEQLSHAQLTETLAAALSERERRVNELLSLTGGVTLTADRPRGPGRPPGSTNKGEPKSAREQQLEAAERGEVPS